jgi:hypothetical protein
MDHQHTAEHHEHTHRFTRKYDLRDYLPLIVIVLVALVSALTGQWPLAKPDSITLMRQFMGNFLVIFAMFKLFDLPGFADGFQNYDLIAKRFRPYALVYLFIELALGLCVSSRLLFCGNQYNLAGGDDHRRDWRADRFAE